ncbi:MULTISPECIES: Eco57I restriction-modification methylase domain-containing protein [unclassified Fibrobacter]|uniref:Eco57I restriction-modification methylase domain-containing protein n=1 Tax=unclassified Fibrobacter TaxID=2634177 RepID=UPI000D6CA5B2|nr:MULTISPECIES: Eco57I restriction-modification methylase domain-containing protein [unclassified Fibrobacter]PWJ68320.1 site-specific DNA-methyltransferase (adenine-specific) [Fibrobacter sp. UWR4]PZW68146.1 site-specific DNA-methyltransferase (adenine-specific) [Fibrobacter sp. UWR1]
MADLKLYNPDVLSCLANLSNDEVFTPPEVVNRMLDMLPQELFESEDTTFLDPCCKTGVFLREIAKRLLKNQMPGYEEAVEEINAKKRNDEKLSPEEKHFMNELQKTVDHIFHKQLYGIAITEMTSLLSRRSVYCTKHPDGEYSISKFGRADGNIRFKKIQHTWVDGKCKYCGASESQYDRDDTLETHAYEWIHTENLEGIFNMKFDVIISNPPYQLSDGGGTGSSAKPIYQLFIEKAKKLKPRYMSMIIPSRWFSGGKGLDDFREEMLKDKSIRKLVDYENFRDVFPGVDLAGGACYFLWDRDNKGSCDVTNFSANEQTSHTRYLDEFDVFVRSNNALKIVRKVCKLYSEKKFLNERISPRLPFGITTTYSPLNSGVPCYFTQKIGLKYVQKKDVDDSLKLLNKWKFLVPKAPIAGQTDFSKPVGFYYDGNTRIAKPGECCSESWLVAGAFDTKEETINYKSYIFTKTVRFLLLQTVVGQNITRKNFCFVPDLEKYDQVYSDDYLRKQWGITDKEWEYIASRIGEIGGDR